MLDLLDRRPERDTRELRPARALLTPTWIGALALLIANDHWLKGSGLLPGALTGKLSDFAGMLVAPTLLAALLSALVGVRSRRALLACHVAVAAVFAGIQLSPAFASQWSALMGALGHPWVITCDPTDLIALPFLILSWRLLVPEMDAALPTLAPLQRSAVGALSVLGLWSTVATSEGGIDPDDVWYEDVFGNVVVNNTNDFEIALHIRTLREDIELDCDQVSADPGRLLSEDAFGEATHWLLPERTNVAIDFGSGRACEAAWIAGEGIEARIVFVPLDRYPELWWPGQFFEADRTSFIASSGVVGVEFGDDGGGSWYGDESILFRPSTDAPEQPESCELEVAQARIDWPLSIPKRSARVLGVDAGVDGCFALELQEVAYLNNELSDEGEPYDFFLCAPEAAVPFAEGELLRFDGYYGDSNPGERELRVTLLDPATLTPALSESGETLRVARYIRGANDPAVLGAGLGRTLVAVPSVGCPWQVDEACASVDRRVDLAVSGGSSFLVAGSPVNFADADTVHTAVLGYAREHSVLDRSCAEGALALRYDIDLAIIDEPLL